eukprot:470990_1
MNSLFRFSQLPTFRQSYGGLLGYKSLCGTVTLPLKTTSSLMQVRYRKDFRNLRPGWVPRIRCRASVAKRFVLDDDGVLLHQRMGHTKKMRKRSSKNKRRLKQLVPITDARQLWKLKKLLPTWPIATRPCWPKKDTRNYGEAPSEEEMIRVRAER